MRGLEQYTMIGIEKYEMCKVFKTTEATEFEENGYVHATAEQKGNRPVVGISHFNGSHFQETSCS